MHRNEMEVVFCKEPQLKFLCEFKKCLGRYFNGKMLRKVLLNEIGFQSGDIKISKKVFWLFVMYIIIKLPLHTLRGDPQQTT